MTIAALMDGNFPTSLLLVEFPMPSQAYPSGGGHPRTDCRGRQISAKVSLLPLLLTELPSVKGSSQDPSVSDNKIKCCMQSLDAIHYSVIQHTVSSFICMRLAQGNFMLSNFLCYIICISSKKTLTILWEVSQLSIRDEELTAPTPIQFPIPKEFKSRRKKNGLHLLMLQKFPLVSVIKAIDTRGTIQRMNHQRHPSLPKLHPPQAPSPDLPGLAEKVLGTPFNILHRVFCLARIQDFLQSRTQLTSDGQSLHHVSYL